MISWKWKNLYNQHMNWTKSMAGKNPIIPIIKPGQSKDGVKDRGWSQPPWCGCVPFLHSSIPVWQKNYWIWSSLRVCWTVNMFQPWTAVLPWVKCDGREGEHGGTYGDVQGIQRKFKKRKKMVAYFCNPQRHKKRLSVAIFYKMLDKSSKFFLWG